MEQAKNAVMQDLLHALMNTRNHLDNLRMLGGEDGWGELRVVLDRKIEELQQQCYRNSA